MRMNGALLWSSKILKIVADSTAHAETAEASRSVKSGTFVRMVMRASSSRKHNLSRDSVAPIQYRRHMTHVSGW